MTLRKKVLLFYSLLNRNGENTAREATKALPTGKTRRNGTLPGNLTEVALSMVLGHCYRTPCSVSAPGSPSIQLDPLPQLSRQDTTRAIDAAHQWLHLWLSTRRESDLGSWGLHTDRCYLGVSQVLWPRYSFKKAVCYLPNDGSV